MKQVTNTSWNTFWWIIGSICMPLSIPFIVHKVMSQLRLRKNKDILEGKVVLITGASSGLGEALSHTFYMAGCKVVLAARRKEELERVRTDLLEMHSRIVTHPPVVIPMDVSDLSTLPEKIAQIEETFGHIDILINNAGISVRADVVSMAVDLDVQVMLVNYFGAVAVTKAVLPKMITRKEGRIVCVSSIQGKFSLPHRSAYSASKHALQAFCDSLRAEVAEHNISVLCVSPGYINTALSLNALTASGRAYGVTDENTATGASPERIADDIRRAILSEEKDVTLAPLLPIAVQWLRLLCPSIYFWVMEKRARRMNASN
ncbi:dehydrogenase/reductase SDR family protein 7-like [Sitodiplosis mosellana]|uniref:dehydrogenase/reductase SDR family protein 7-like n=1 Tax=Sitodiplosis mosellana TaxID=263140 RepID=UPI002445058F|nr:dehydrogenase/reductase SDR family protein 7-like [Sitodiplosis mosellana]